MSSSSSAALYEAGPRYRAHLVKESLSTRFCKALCSCFLSLLLVAALFLFLVWLNLRPHRPRFHLISFSFPALRSHHGSGSAGSISFNVTDRNPNEKVGIFYAHSASSLFYRELRIGNAPMLFPFYQPPKNSTSFVGVFRGRALGVDNTTWRDLGRDVEEGGSVEFRLELRSRVRFKVSTWDSRRSHKLHASCHVAVGLDGELLPSFKGKKCSLYFF